MITKKGPRSLIQRVINSIVDARTRGTLTQVTQYIERYENAARSRRG